MSKADTTTMKLDSDDIALMLEWSETWHEEADISPQEAKWNESVGLRIRLREAAQRIRIKQRNVSNP